MNINKTPNRLINETSPYLLQHAYNPVDWFAWGNEALTKAKEENKVILVSIGYSACHWCHVMEHESFEDEETAALMNALFVNIKIDREERPDLDMIYMDAVQTMSGSGGWPLNCFLTPDGKPFFGGTYFPPERAYNRSSWKDILHAVQDAWDNKQEDVIAQAENLLEQISSVSQIYNLNNDDNDYEDTISKITDGLMKQADRVCGGFGGAPKFPQTYSLMFLLRLLYKSVNRNEVAVTEEVRDFVILSIDKMIAGGIYDQLEGGFARYSTDSRWIVPHFEKMLYDNALLIGLLSEAYQLTKFERYKVAIEQSVNFVKQNWLDTDGGFFSALDADSEGEEGKYYTWTYDELEKIITEEQQLKLFCKYYNISKNGNWEHTNILWYNDNMDLFCINNRLDIGETKELLESCRVRLLAERQNRIKPLLDDKKLLGWNAMMVTALLKVFRALGNEDALEISKECISFIEQNMKQPDGSYFHNYKAGKGMNEANLEDLSQYLYALLNLKGVTGLSNWDTIINNCFEIVDREFTDNESPYFYFTPQRQRDLVVRKQEFYDGATASGNSMMLLSLQLAKNLEEENPYFSKVDKMLTGVKHMFEKYPTSFSNWALGYQISKSNIYVAKISGKMTEGDLKEMLTDLYPNIYIKHIDSDNFIIQRNEIEGVGKPLYEINLCNDRECASTIFNFDEVNKYFD